METALEHILISSNKAGMISFMNAHPEAFEEAVKLAVSQRQPYSWRAAWLLWSCLKVNDIRIRKFRKDIINSILKIEDGHQRELLKILLLLDFDKEDEGILFNVCTNVWVKIHKRPSVRITALKIIIKIAEQHHDLSNEVLLLCQNHYLESLSPAAKKSVLKMIRGISHT